MGPVLQNFPLYAEGSRWAPTHPKMTPSPPVTPHSSTSCTHHHSWGRTQISCHDMLHVRARRSLMQKPDGGNISHCYISVIKRDGRKREQTSVGLQSSTTISCMPRRAQTLHYETEFFKAGFGAENCWQKQNDRNHSSRSRHLSTALMAAGDASPWQPRLQWNCCLRNYGSDDGRAGRLNNKRSSCSSLAVYALCLHEILEINRNENLCQIWSITKPITEPQCLTPLWSDEGPEQKSQLQGCSQKTQGKDFLAGSGGSGTSDLMVALNNLHKSTASVLPAPKLSKKAAPFKGFNATSMRTSFFIENQYWAAECLGSSRTCIFRMDSSWTWWVKEQTQGAGTPPCIPLMTVRSKIQMTMGIELDIKIIINLTCWTNGTRHTLLPKGWISTHIPAQTVLGWCSGFPVLTPEAPGCAQSSNNSLILPTLPLEVSARSRATYATVKQKAARRLQINIGNTTPIMAWSLILAVYWNKNINQSVLRWLMQLD